MVAVTVVPRLTLGEGLRREVLPLAAPVIIDARITEPFIRGFTFRLGERSSEAEGRAKARGRGDSLPLCLFDGFDPESPRFKETEPLREPEDFLEEPRKFMAFIALATQAVSRLGRCQAGC